MGGSEVSRFAGEGADKHESKKSRTVRVSVFTKSEAFFFFCMGNRQKEKSSCLNKELARNSIFCE